MGNTVTAYNPIFYAQETLKNVEDMLGFASRVYRGFDSERKSAEQGDVIQIRRPGTFETSAGGTAAYSEVTTSSVNITLNNYRQVKFKLSDQEIVQGGERLITDHIRPASVALASYIDAQVATLSKDVPWQVDVGSTVSSADIINPRKILRENIGAMVDSGPVYYAIDETMEASFLGLDIFSNAATSGETTGLRRGFLGERFGVQTFVNQNLRTHTSGTVISAGTDNAGALNGEHAKGLTSISVNNFDGSETFKAGDSFVIAGNTQRYVVTADTSLTTGANAAVPIFPALVQTYTTASVVTFPAVSSTHAESYATQLMFHPNAFALAFAPLPQYERFGTNLGANISTVTDPLTGLSIRARMAYTDATAFVTVTLDVLFGVKTLDPNFAVILRRG